MQVYQLWMGNTGVWIAGAIVLGLPILGMLAACRCSGRRTLHEPWLSSSMIACGPGSAPFRSQRQWFGAALLGDRLVFGVILVVASTSPLLQVLLVSCLVVCVCAGMQSAPCVIHARLGERGGGCART